MRPTTRAEALTQWQAESLATCAKVYAELDRVVRLVTAGETGKPLTKALEDTEDVAAFLHGIDLGPERSVEEERETEAELAS